MSAQKTLLILGGSRYIMPVIEAAHELGCRVVTCDYLPDNYAHRFADEYVNASIIDKDAILQVAKDVKADGITSFAADPGVVTAAYVAEQLDLPFQGSYESVCILQNKDRFRSFLREHGFNCPQAFRFSSIDEAMAKADELPYPVIAKPTDSAGSKGVTRVDVPENLAAAVAHALDFSLSGGCIVEQFIEKSGASSGADAFISNGIFTCVSFTDQLFDLTGRNPYVPAAYLIPSSMSACHQHELVNDLQRLATLLGLRDGIYNIESRVGVDGRSYIMEVSPRGGGNRLSETLREITGVDLIKAGVLASLGMPVGDLALPECIDGYWYQQMFHSEVPGVFKGLWYADGFKERHVVDEQLWIGLGDKVEPFDSAGFAFGSILLRFDQESDRQSFLDKPTSFFQARVS